MPDDAQPNTCICDATQGQIDRTVHARNAPNSTKINTSRTSLTLKILAEIDSSALRGGIARRGGRFVAHLRGMGPQKWLLRLLRGGSKPRRRRYLVPINLELTTTIVHVLNNSQRARGVQPLAPAYPH